MNTNQIPKPKSILASIRAKVNQRVPKAWDSNLIGLKVFAGGLRRFTMVGGENEIIDKGESVFTYNTTPTGLAKTDTKFIIKE